ncbi:hypothetical protein Cgig2_005359 [Carnegiea gigantea]|uniref:Pentatricopeptide repeat-containing protein n=1 Tax=Carnegiea gigantea TaxID=171969 RepID=A0A9Q1QCW9_9CARY|nr:hypothetical protein Cgig2_005359 [Carnegiea gigantea]
MTYLSSKFQVGSIIHIPAISYFVRCAYAALAAWCCVGHKEDWLIKHMDMLGDEAIQVFNDMKKNNIDADSMTLLAASTACNLSGLVEEAQALFHGAIKENKIPLGIEHYACLVDAGCLLDQLLRFGVLWYRLASCKDHGRLEVANELAHELINLEPDKTLSC